MYDDESDILLGASNLRHYLTDEGLKFWGHIGYGIRQSERRKNMSQNYINQWDIQEKEYK